jgi:hypothetical protein
MASVWRVSGEFGERAEAEAIWREAADAGHPDALHGLARWLSVRPGRETEAHLMY